MRTSATEHRALLTVFLVGFFLVLVVRTAWLCDDAYITFRTVDNFVAGYGLRWNVIERVQSFTHPLWLFVFALPYYFTREAYFTALAATTVFSVAAFAILIGRCAASTATALIAGLTLAFSKSFVDYSTSGLENPLTHLLLVLMLLADWSVEEDGRGLTRFWIAGGLAILNRLDLALLVLPVLVVRSWRFHWSQAVRAAAIGLAPLLLWEGFSIVYYGFAFPNTAYAKLQTGVGAGELAEQGLLYLLAACSIDPVTPLMLGATATALAVTDLRRHWPILFGIALYLAYIVRVGGDFMAGRMLTAPLVVGVAVWARMPWRFPRGFVPVALAMIVGLGTLATVRPAITSGAETFVLDDSREGMTASGVADERAYWYRYTGLLRYSRARTLPWNARVQRGQELRDAGPAVVQVANVGFIGYYAGPAVTIIDEFALTDAFLARLPSDPDWRIGHYHRTLPAGYLESVRNGRNQLADVELAMKYERLIVVTQGPIWAKKRWRGILALNRD